MTGHNNGNINVWDTKNRELVFSFEDAHADPVNCVKFTPDENYLVSISKDDTLKVWDVR